MRRSTSQHGETLIEILISVVLIGLIVATILPEYFTASVASQAHRNFVVADQLLRNNAEAVKGAVRTQCTSPSSTYTTTTTSAAGFSVSVNPSAGQCPPVTSVQQVDLTVTMSNGVTRGLSIDVRSP